MSIFRRNNSLRSGKAKASSISIAQPSSFQKPHVSITTPEDDTNYLTSPRFSKPKGFVSSLKEPSFKDLQFKEGYATPLSLKPQNHSSLLRKRAQTSSSQLRLSTDTAEYHDDYYLGGKQKFMLSNGTYKAFQQNLQKTCFDKDGHPIYLPAPNQQPQQAQNQNRERLKSEDSTQAAKNRIMNAKQEEKRFLSGIEAKVKKTTNEAFLVTIMRDLAKAEFQQVRTETSDKSSLCVDESRVKYLDALKGRSISMLLDAVKSGKTQEGYAMAQAEVERNQLEMKKIVEETMLDQCVFISQAFQN